MTSEKGFRILCTAIRGNLVGFLFKVVKYHYDGKYMHEIFKQISYRSLVASFIVLFSETTFCGFPWVETSTAGRVYDLCVYYMTGAPEGSPKVVLCGFLWFYGEAGNRTCDPWFTRHSTYPLHRFRNNNDTNHCWAEGELTLTDIFIEN